MAIRIVVLLLLVAAVVGGVAYVNSVKTPSDIPAAPAPAKLAESLRNAHAKVEPDGSPLGVKDPARLGASMYDWLGNRMESDVLFPGGAPTLLAWDRAYVAGPGRSAHIAVQSEGKPVSVFIQQYMMLPELERNKVYELPGTPKAVVFLQGGKLAMVVSDDDAALGRVLTAMGGSGPRVPYPQ